jgi:hypothetical protein
VKWIVSRFFNFDDNVTEELLYFDEDGNLQKVETKPDYDINADKSSMMGYDR